LNAVSALTRANIREVANALIAPGGPCLVALPSRVATLP
jgi:hypothetical protein